MSLTLGAALAMTIGAAASRAERLEVHTTEVAPGVFRLRVGEPEVIVPSLVRAPARTEALAALPPIAAPPLPPAAITVWRLARGCRLELPLGNGEVIYGLGLQCKHLVQNGWRRTLFAGSGDDNGKGVSHAPVPFYVSTAGYGVLVDSARYVTFSIGEKQRLADASKLDGGADKGRVVTDVAELYGPERRDQTSVYIDVPTARGVDLYLFAGPALGQAVARYNLFSGGGCLPALSGLGPGYICGAMLDAAAVLKICDELQRNGMPVTTLGLEPGWQTHAYSSSYVWDPAKFPPDFGRALRARGYDANLWCQLYVDPSSPLLPLLGGGFGDFEVWRGVVPDLVDPKVREAYRDFLAANFVRQGIAGFKLDEVDGSNNTGGAYQEWQFPEFTAFPSGADGEQMRNLLGRLGTQAIDGAFRVVNRRTFGLVRATGAWAAPVPMALYSDEYDFGDYLRYGLSAGVQGLLWTPEVRHAESERDWALRLGAAAFSARMLINGWQFPHPVWQQPNLGANERGQLLPADNPYEKLARRFANLRMVLLPYLYQAYSDYQQRGIAPVRPLVADYPDDPRTWHLDDQWLLGPDLLVAPVTDHNAFAQLYRVALTDGRQLTPLDRATVNWADGVAALEIAGAHDGLVGATMEVDLKAGPCTLRLSARGPIGRLATRLQRIENGHFAGEFGETYKDDIRLDPTAWSEQTFQFRVPTAGHYRLYLSKGYFLRPPQPRRLEVRDVAFEQPQGDPRQSWQRQVYLPAGAWRDFWTGAPLAGGQTVVVAATPQRPPVFVRDGTLLPLAEPLVTIDEHSVFTVHLASYGEGAQACALHEDDGVTFAYEQGRWATLTAHADGTLERPDHGQPIRYRIAAKAEAPTSLIERLAEARPSAAGA
jgi:alpha-D-xyloside xylohydrolase